MNSPDLSPKLSIIIPAFERLESLTKSIKSVLSQIDSTAELIVVDDHSPLPLENQIDLHPVKWIRLDENSGPSTARNRGIEAAQGEWLTFLDSDDCWLDGRFDQLNAIMDGEEQKGLQIWGTAILRRKKIEARYHCVPQRGLEDPLHFAGCRMQPMSTMILKKTVFDVIGLFDEKIRRLEDYEILMRFFALGGKYHMDKDARVYVDGVGSSGLDRVEPAVEHIRRGLTRVPKIVNAYLNLELARAAWEDRNYLGCAKYVFFSRNQYRRFGLQIQPAKDRKLKAAELDLLASFKSISD